MSQFIRRLWTARRNAARQLDPRAGQHREAGITTAEYAVGTVGGIGIVGVLFKLLMSDWFQELIKALIEAAFKGFGL